MSESGKKMAIFSDYVNEFTRMLRRVKLKDWNSADNTRDNLKLQLALRKKLLQLRTIAIETQSEVYRECGKIADKIKQRSAPYDIIVEQARGFGRSRTSGDYSRTYAITRYSTQFPNDKELREVSKLCKEFDETIKHLQELYVQCGSLLEMPNYLAIKKYLPAGGRDAISALIACSTGKTSENKAQQHELLGWAISDSHTSESLNYILRSLRPLREKMGSAPSRKRGYHLLTTAWVNYSQDSDSIHHRRRMAINAMMARNFKEGQIIPVIGGYNSRSSLSARIAIELCCRNMREDYIRNYRLAQAICGAAPTSYLQTIISSRPVYCGDIQGDGDSRKVYRAAGFWNNGNSRHGEQEGRVYFVAGFPDCYHSEESESEEDIFRKLQNRFISWCSEQKRRAEYEKRQLEASKLLKKEVADLLRKLRSIQIVKVEDSYRVGNCRPGTAQFMTILGITSAEISGRELAKRWKKAGYTARERFAPVVRALEVANNGQ